MKKVLAFLLGVWILTSCSSSADQASEKAITRTVADSIYRPAYHFSPYKNWIGTPISMVYHNNEYHLFYQYNSEDTDMESDSWGHAVSSDMMKWEEVNSISFFEDNEQGSIVSDSKNSSELGQNPLVAFVGTSDGVMLSYSEDEGNSWKNYDNNPILETEGIPKVSWIENQWIMTVTKDTQVTFFSSEDLIHWSQESKLSLEKAAKNTELFSVSDSWGLLINSKNVVEALVGEFDGSTFIPTKDPIPFDLGPDNSAGTISNISGRSVYIGHMSNQEYMEDLPTKSWQSSFTLPRELSVNEINQIKSFPISEINTVLTAKRRGKVDLLKSRSSSWYSFTVVSASADIEVTVLNNEDEKLVLRYDQSSFILDRSASGLTNFNSSFEELVTFEYESLSDTIKFDIFIDRSSVEIFINDGEVQLSSLVFPQNPYKSVEIIIDGEKKNIPATIYDIDKVMF
ncbi:MAG: glycoside hydrolase family 32 protein [Ekhidna sp.]